MSDLMMRLSELTRDLFAVGSEEDGRTAAEADARIREQRALLAECWRILAWYEEHARLARLVHSEGDKGRNAIAADGGAQARATLARLRAQEKADEATD